MLREFCYRISFKGTSIFRNMSQTQWFYAVGRGRQVGVYTSWTECQKQVENISNAKFRKFKTQKEAVAFIQECKDKYSPYKSPAKSQFLRDTVNKPSVLKHPTQQTNRMQPLQLIHDNNLLLTQELVPNSSNVVTTERMSRSEKVPEDHNHRKRSSVNLSPQTVLALESLAEHDTFDLEQTEKYSQHSATGGTGNENAAVDKILQTVERYFSEFKVTLDHIVQKINGLENKIQELSFQVTNRNSSVEMQGCSGLGVKRKLLENYNVPQAIGSRHLSSKNPNEEIEIIPVPPKKIPKVELNSDDEVDGFNYDFKVNENGYVIVYTDGSCERNGRAGAKAGIGVWFGDKHPLNCSEPVHGRATNNTAEIQAAVQAVEIAKRAGVKKVLICTDSEFLINCVTKWMPKWMKNNWKLASGGDVKNKADLILLNDAMKKIDLKWEHVRGHQGVHGNEMADMLARSGAERYKL